MLSRRERLPKADFGHVVEHSKSCFSRLFVCRWVKNNHEVNRFAVVVSSNICPLAVDRNRKRRQTYEILRQSKVSIDPALDMILFGKKSLAAAPYEMIEKDIYHLLRQLEKNSRIPSVAESTHS